MLVSSGALIRNRKITCALTVEVLPRSKESGVIPSLQTLEWKITASAVEDNRQCSILLVTEGQEEENPSSMWPHDSCGKRPCECVVLLHLVI